MNDHTNVLRFCNRWWHGLGWSKGWEWLSETYRPAWEPHGDRAKPKHPTLASQPARAGASPRAGAGQPLLHVTVPEIKARVKGRGPWTKSLPPILETLEGLGRARREETGGTDIWRA